MNDTAIILKKGREKLPRNRHPWIYSGAMAKVPGGLQAGDRVAVLDHAGGFIATGHYSPRSKIAVRLLEWDPSAPVDDDWFAMKIERALELRRPVLSEGTDVCRLVFSEGDFLPGLVVDRFGPFAVLQALTPGMDRMKKKIAAMLLRADDTIAGVYEKSAGDGRVMEGLDDAEGQLAGDTVPDALTVREGGNLFTLRLTGQKTGFFADQRENRRIAASYARGRSILDVFSYGGAFSVYALRNGAADVLCCDSSAGALADAEENMSLNGFGPDRFASAREDAFPFLRKLRDEGRTFGMVILDPPKLAPNRASLERALAGYKDLNLNAMKVLEPGGVLVTFSCSGAVTRELFTETVAFAAKDASREAQVLERLGQPADHPARLSVPETEYLKGLVLRVF